MFGAEQPKSLAEYVLRNAEQNPEGDAVVTHTLRLSHADLRDQMIACAQKLERSGVKTGDCIAVLTQPGASFLISFLAANFIGAVWLGLTPKHTPAELAYVINDAEPKIVLVDELGSERDYEADIAQIISHLPGTSQSPLSDFTLYSISEASPAHDDRRADSSASALLVYTSGSTGKPKGALIGNKAIVKAAHVRLDAWGHSDFRSLLNLPINHVGGASDIVGPTIVACGALVCMKRFDAAATAAIIDREQVSFLFQVPTQLQMIFAAPETSAASLSSLKAVCWSGARAPDELVDALAERFPGRLGSDYSMTESVGPVTLFELGASADALKSSTGLPPAGRTVRLDPHSGEILVADDALFSAYLNRPQATAETLTEEGWLKTGDIGALDSEGHLRLIGRVKEMFVSGGFNIYPAEIEAVLETHPDIQLAAVISKEDETWGEVGIAFVAANAAIDSNTIKAFCAERLANYKLPKSIFVLPELPQLAIGKVDKKALKNRLLPA